jgi:hypothetical protein
MHLTGIAGDWDIQKSVATKWRQAEGALEVLPRTVTAQQRLSRRVCIQSWEASRYSPEMNILLRDWGKERRWNWNYIFLCLNRTVSVV